MKLNNTVRFQNLLSLTLKLSLALILALPIQFVRAQSNPSDIAASAELSGYPLEFQKSLELLDKALAGEAYGHPLDTFRLLDQEIIRKARKYEYVNSNSIRSELDEAGNILIFDGFELIQKIFISSKQVVKFGDYIVAVEKSGYIAEHGMQNLLFIDLNFFASALGRTEVAVFRVPVQTNIEINSLRLSTKGSEQELLLVAPSKEVRLTQEVFKVFSNVQQVAFNMTVNLADPASLERTGPMVESFTKYFNKSTELAGESVLNQVLGSEDGKKYFETWGKNLQASLEHSKRVGDAKAHSEEMKAAQDKMETLLFHFQNTEAYQESLKSISENMKASRKMTNRLAMIAAEMTVPRPNDAPKVIASLALIAGGLIKANRDQLTQGFRGLAHHKYFRRGAYVVAAAAIGATYPQEVAQFFYQGLDITSQIASSVWGRAKDLGHLASEAFKTTLSGFDPSVFKEAYLTPERLPKVAVGMAAIVGTLYMTLGMPHLIVNTAKLIKDLRKTDFSPYREQGLSGVGMLKQAFIDRQNREQEKYISALAQAEAKKYGSERKLLTPEEEKELDEILKTVEKQDKGILQRFIDKAGMWSSTKELNQKSNNQIESFAGALKHFLFSYSSFTNAGIAYTKIWNTWFAIRAYMWKPGPSASLFFIPSTWFTLLAFPNYFSRITARGSQMSVPTQMNGAFRGWKHQLGLRMIPTDQRELLERWEDKVIDVETEVYKASLAKTYEALVKYLKNSDTVKALYDKQGIQSLTDANIELLSASQKVFFRMYFDKLFEKSMTTAMSEIVAQDKHFKMPIAELEKMDTEFLKGVSMTSIENLKISKQDATRIVSQNNDSSVFEYASRETDRRFKSTDVWVSYLKHQTLTKLSPDNNAQTRRLLSVNRQMQKPEAMARAVRSMISSNLIDKPMELAFLFTCMAGITTGILQPIQDQMFSENSWFFLSRYVFGNGFLAGVVMGVMADVWMKLQQDERLDTQLGKVPTGKDAEKGFFRYLMQQTFRNPNNTWWANQKHNLMLIWANMKPAMVTVLTVNLLTLGRFDLDSYIVGYMFSFFAPFSGIAMKLEQGFELASGWVARNIPEKYRSQAKVQEYVNGQIQKRRLTFNLVYKVYENLLGYIVGNFSNMTTAAYGSRSFSRILFGGYTPTEIAATGLEKVSSSSSAPGPVKWVVQKCETLLLNNYTDAVKVKK